MRHVYTLVIGRKTFSVQIISTSTAHRPQHVGYPQPPIHHSRPLHGFPRGNCRLRSSRSAHHGFGPSGVPTPPLPGTAVSVKRHQEIKSTIFACPESQLAGYKRVSVKRHQEINSTIFAYPES